MASSLQIRTILALLAAFVLWPLGAPAQFTFEGLDLSEGSEEEAATEAAEEAEEAQPLSFEGVDVMGRTADRQKFDASLNLFNERSYEAAALGFHQILEDPASVEQNPQAEYLLGKTLYRMGMYHSALSVFKKILAKGESHPYFKTSLEWLFFISRKSTNQTVVLDEIARFAGAEFPERYREEYRYLLARYNFVRGKALLDAAEELRQGEERQGYETEATTAFEETRRLLAMVPPESRFFARARYLDGLTLYVLNRFNPSLEAFKDVVRTLNPRRTDQPDPALREQAFMQLARLHYEHDQNRHAAFYYDRIARGSDQWLQSLFESSWAYFRMGENEQALGNMITLQSPFFRDEYFPEALLLQSVIYYENCRYPEANRLVDDFRARYLPLYLELEKILARGYSTPQDYYMLLADLQRTTQEGEAGEINRMLEGIVRLALSDKELNHLNDSILELESELDGIGTRRDSFRFSSLAKDLGEELKAQRVELQRKAGFYAKRKLERERQQLANLNYRALAIKAEIGTREKEMLEASLAEGMQVSPIENYRYSAAVDDDHVYWPFEGEFWRDELGTYQYTLTKGCKSR